MLKELAGLSYVKMDAQGNDFIFLDGLRNELSLSPQTIKDLAARDNKLGGCDQVLLCEPPSATDADFFMRIYNADGGAADQCGNGARCFLHYARRQGLTGKREIVLQTARRNLGLRLLEVDRAAAQKSVVELGMGRPDFDAGQVIKPEQLDSLKQSDGRYRLGCASCPAKGYLDFYALSFGNSHLVRIMPQDEIAEGMADIKGPNKFCEVFGESFARHPALINGANVGFASIARANNSAAAAADHGVIAGGKSSGAPTITLFTEERGAGKTLACGSNACAVFAVACEHFDIGAEAQMLMRGGSARMRLGAGGEVFMAGEVSITAAGTF